MRKTSIPNKLNHKPQAQARVCKENRELEKNEILLKYFAVKGSNLKGCRTTVTLPIEMKIATRILHNIKVLVL